jgi:hypothetical protein
MPNPVSFVATPVNITVATDVIVVAKPTSSTAAYNRLLRIISAQNNDGTDVAVLALFIGPSATGIKIWEGPLGLSAAGVAGLDFTARGGDRSKEYGLAIVDTDNLQEDLVATVTTIGAEDVYLNVLTQTGGGGI